MVGMPVCEHSVNHTQRFGFASLQPCSPSSRPTGQVKPPDPKPQVTSLRSSPGANRVAPLRGAERYELALVRGAGRGVELLKFAYCRIFPKIIVVLFVCC